MDNDQEAYLSMLKREGRPHTFKCGNCGVWWGVEHSPDCPEPKMIVVELK